MDARRIDAVPILTAESLETMDEAAGSYFKNDPDSC